MCLLVAVTRAQALLIIVGDPSVISLDPLWRKFLNRIYNNRAWRGDPPTWDTTVEVKMSGGYDSEVVEETIQDMNEFTNKVTKLTLGDLLPQSDEVVVAVNDDRPWQEIEQMDVTLDGRMVMFWISSYVELDVFRVRCAMLENIQGRLGREDLGYNILQ